MIRTLHADGYVTVTLDEHTNVVRYTRSATTTSRSSRTKPRPSPI